MRKSVSCWIVVSVVLAGLGVFRTRESTRMEFMELIKQNLNIVR
jgi:hypothetical protein